LANTGTLNWNENDVEPQSTEFRDGHFSAAIGRTANDKRLCRWRAIAV
jgi:hypothetical protein